METSKLIQRVRKPRVNKLAMHNPFTFGAGGGRLRPEALDLLAPVFSFDYMMAAEYEFGAVPEGLMKFQSHFAANALGFSKIVVSPNDVKLDTSYLQETLRIEPVQVYIIGNTNDMAEIQRRVRLLATDEDRCLQDMWKKFKGKLHEGLYVRDSPSLSRYIKMIPHYEDPCLGGIELENGFFFTVDPSMAERFAALFGLMIEIKTTS
jgi:hypothetical protein